MLLTPIWLHIYKHRKTTNHLYADDICLFCMGKDIKTIEDQLSKDFNSLCKWFIDNKLSIHFGEEKTKSILFSIIKRLNNSRNLDIRYNDIEIKHHSKVINLPGMHPRQQSVWQAMATKVLGTINRIIKFLYSKQKFYASLCIDCYAIRWYNHISLMHSPAWYPDFNKCFVKIFQVCQNKCIWFCLKLNNRDHVGVKEFREINWLSTKKRSEQCVCPNIFKFFRHISATCTFELYKHFNHGHKTRRSNCRLQKPYRNTTYDHEALSFSGPK